LIDFSKSIAQYHSQLEAIEREEESTSQKPSPAPSHHPITDDPKDERVLSFMRKSLSKELKMTVVEWTCMQNPLKNFDHSFRPQLPGLLNFRLFYNNRSKTSWSRLWQESRRNAIVFSARTKLIYF
jgi:hypothetical protein